MDLLTGFKHYLATQKSHASPATVKNYLADISRFIRWYEARFNAPFSTNSIPADIIQLYKRESILSSDLSQQPAGSSYISERSFARHLASLRKFFQYLKDTYHIPHDPFAIPTQPKPLSIDDRWQLTIYKDYLFTHKASHHTIKNYINDLRQFVTWLESVAVVTTNPEVEKNTIFSLITASVLTEYKTRLMHDAGFSPLSINRKLSSLRKYISWLQEKKLLNNTIALDLSNISTGKTPVIDPLDSKFLLTEQDDRSYENSEQMTQQTAKTYPWFPPFRLLQKIVAGLSLLTDSLLIIPLSGVAEKIQFMLFKLTGQSIFTPLYKGASQLPQAQTLLDTAIVKGVANNVTTVNVTGSVPMVKNLTKTFYAPLTISTAGMSFWQRLFYTVRYVRPEWYKRYHTYQLVHYVHFGILILYGMGLVLGIYSLSVNGSSYQLPVIAASEVDPPKLLSFSGKLTAQQSSLLTANNTLRFSLYNNNKASGSALLWQEVRTVNPDTTGKFSLTLGQQVPIPANLLVENPNLFLGISVGSSTEMQPREQIATAGLATSARSVNGLKPITETGETKNTLLALDSAGNLAIGGPGTTFEATEGGLTLSGQTLLLTTNLGSNANLTLAPDGQGAIDVQKALINSTEDNNLKSALGAVEVDDNFAVLASSSATAVTIQQNGIGDFITASASGLTRFNLDYLGNGTFSGDLNVGGSNLTTRSTTFNLLPDTAINVSIGNSATALTIGATSGITAVRNNFQVSGNTNLGDSTGDVITIAGHMQPAGNSVQDIGTTTNAFNNGYLTNLFLTPTATTSGFLRRNGNAISFTNTGDSLLLGSSNQSGALIKLSANSGADSYINSGKLGLGTTASLTDQLQVYGDIRVGTSTTDGCLKRYDGTAIAGTCSSDRRFKKDIAPITDVLGKLAQVQPVTYHMRADEFPQYGFGTGTSYGLIAQDLEKVFPDLVETDNNGYKMVKYGPELTMISLEGIRELTLEVQKMKANLSLSPSGDILIGKDPISGYQAQTADGSPITATAGFFKLIAANISAGLISAKEGVFDSLSIATENLSIGGTNIRDYIIQVVRSQQSAVSGQVSVVNTKTDLVSPLASNSEIAIAFRNSQISILNSHSATASAVATIDREGNASFSGQLTSKTVTTSDASVSGTLRAGRIITDGLDLSNEALAKLGDKLGTLAAQQNASSSASSTVTNIYNIYNTASNSAVIATSNATSSASPTLASAQASNGLVNATYADLGSASASLAYVPRLNSDFATITQGLMVFGATSMADVSVAGQLAIGGKLIIADNTINVLGSTLEIQPLRQGNISFMGGLLTINTNGDVEFNGNATFARDVSIKGTLAAHIIAPVPSEDLVIKLPDPVIANAQVAEQVANAGRKTPKFVIQNASGSAVLAIDHLGDLIASGTATLGSLSIVRGASADTSTVETVASGSAGLSAITAGYTSRTIYSPYVTKDSLIYITPRSRTSMAVPYLARQNPADAENNIESSFTVQIPTAVSEDIEFNWWIVN